MVSWRCNSLSPPGTLGINVKRLLETVVQRRSEYGIIPDKFGVAVKWNCGGCGGVRSIWAPFFLQSTVGSDKAWTVSPRPILSVGRKPGKCLSTLSAQGINGTCYGFSTMSWVPDKLGFWGSRPNSLHADSYSMDDSARQGKVLHRRRSRAALDILVPVPIIASFALILLGRSAWSQSHAGLC